MDIVLPEEVFYTLKDENYSFRCIKKFDAYGNHYYWHRPGFEIIKDAVYCIKKYDEYYKKKEKEEKIEDYYLNDNYEVVSCK